MHFKRTLGGLLLLSLTLCGSGCTALRPQPALPAPPPAELLADCPEPLPPTEHTNAGLAQGIQDFRAALSGCNADKAALREFFK